MALPKTTHPTYKIELPSSKRSVPFRPVLARDRKILMAAAESEDPADVNEAVRQVVQNCSVASDFDVDGLTFFDLEWVFVQLWGLSVEADVEMRYRDAEDGKTRDFKVSLTSDVTVEPAPAAGGPPAIETDSGVSLKFRYPGVAEYVSREAPAEGEDQLDFLARRCLVTVTDSEGRAHDVSGSTTDEVRSLLGDLDSKAFDAVRKLFAEDLPRPRRVIEYVNESGTARRIELSKLEDFFTLR